METSDLVPIALFFSIAFVVVGITRAISEGRTRRAIIRAGVSPELVHALSSAPRTDNIESSLKWGLVIGGVGLALILLQFLPYRANDPIATGLVLLFGALGLLGHYAYVRRSQTAP